MSQKAVRFPNESSLTTENRRNTRKLDWRVENGRIFFAHVQFEPETHPAMYGTAPTDENSNFPLRDYKRPQHTAYKTGAPQANGVLKLLPR